MSEQFNKEVIYLVEDERSINYKYEKNYDKIDKNIQICSYEYDAPILKEQCRIIPYDSLSKGDILIKHPYEKNCYIHIEESEDEIFKYKCQKISKIAGLLGASICDIKLELKEEEEKIFEKNGKITVKKIGIDARKKKEESEKLSQKFIIKDTYTAGNSFTEGGYKKAKEIAECFNDTSINGLVEMRSPDFHDQLKKRMISVELTREFNRSLDYAITLNALPKVFTLSAQKYEIVKSRKKILFQMEVEFN
jgi:hypothetical protein